MSSGRTADRTAAWVLYVLQLAGEGFLALFWLMSVMAGDSCGSVPHDLRMCSGNYFAQWFFGYAAVLVAGAVVTPVAIVLAGRRGGRRWPWPLLTIGGLFAASWAYAWAVTR